MALFSCGECGREISSLAPACPGCGWPVPHHDSMSVGTPALPEPPRPGRHAPSVRVTLTSPDSLGQAVVTSARAATKSRVCGKLFKTLDALASVWAVLFSILALAVLFFGKNDNDRVAVAAFVFAIGLAAPLVVWALGSWVDWLKK